MSHPAPLSTLLGRAQAAFVAEFDRRLAEAGFADLSYALGTNVLRFLDAEQGIRLTRLVELSGVTKQAISQQVGYLQERGYVSVGPDPADSRAKLVRLTEKGSRSQAAARPQFGAVEEEWRRRFGEAEMGALRRTLERIITGMGAGSS